MARRGRSSKPRDLLRERRAAETGTLVKEAPDELCLLYPSPYAAGMSSLGFQSLYRAVNETPGRAAHRAFLPDDVPSWKASRAPLVTYEAEKPVGGYPVIGLSVAYEIELAGVIEVLELAGLPALAEERDDRHPFVLAGGPLTFSNPLPLGPYVDAVLMGEADETLHQALDVLFALGPGRKDQALRALADAVPSAWVPALHGDAMPPVARCDDALLPARSQIVTPHTELRDMFLIEPERGCHRGCSYCVMRRSTNGGMRTVDADRVVGLVPDHAKRVGLVGAATTDHPQITEIVERLVDSGREVGLSSLRADRLNDRFLAALRRGGQTVLTTASDGASQRLRDLVQRRAREDVLERAAELARAHGFKRLKLYMMVGLPEETEEDIDELIAFSLQLAKRVPLSLGIAPFCAKRNTPLDGAPFAGIDVVERRLKRLRRGVKGKVDLRATSARWAWVEYVLAQGGQAEGRAVLDAVRAGGRFRHWKGAFEALPEDRPRRAIVRPGNRVDRTQQQRRRALPLA
ncbi:MAG TPA: radical SAM protein [Polyangiaceae bacterium LLY-WYZ-15_(1-7)]|nr:radical SAM protein [Polyangiaceae bacterium LLY-WYZ-15_(1-7)]HJL13854.1 radical SAM protein [Polyangiaceae bacterium LLY-WYZ-15_(1-7)]HJL26583.1 radical SAM protein [Polyangiaceae bacterium LLY-WYZ-15_(1-7)]HJL38512.1 radical SAM protein [Polyangiaceae bacterium LLY-WYZ-15_(1-7)]HJL46558.1 radical SAM protein [Polyangiaceae bacterium LLY-WYZ-15_(1-7)]